MINKTRTRPLILFSLILGLITGCASNSYTVMTYNIHIGIGMDGELDLERIAQVIRESNVDMAVLQEVDKGTERTLGVNQAEHLATLLDMDYRFGRSIDHDGGEYGNALLSKYPILNFEVHELKTEHGFEDRTVFEAQILIEEDTLFLMGTHLGLDTLERIDQIDGILSIQPYSTTLILGGDFNFESGSVPYEMITETLRDGILEIDSKPSNTFPADKPDRRIDYIFIGSGIEVAQTKMQDSALIQVASDHRPQILKFRFK